MCEAAQLTFDALLWFLFLSNQSQKWKGYRASRQVQHLLLLIFNHTWIFFIPPYSWNHLIWPSFNSSQTHTHKMMMQPAPAVAFVAAWDEVEEERTSTVTVRLDKHCHTESLRLPLWLGNGQMQPLLKFECNGHLQRFNCKGDRPWQIAWKLAIMNAQWTTLRLKFCNRKVIEANFNIWKLPDIKSWYWMPGQSLHQSC